MDENLILKTEDIPGYVYDAFNACIARGFDGCLARVLQKDVVAEILRLGPDELERPDIFARGYLEIEKSYEARGWSVWYDRTDLVDPRGSSFTFRRSEC